MPSEYCIGIPVQWRLHRVRDYGGFTWGTIPLFHVVGHDQLTLQQRYVQQGFSVMLAVNYNGEA